MPEEKRRVKKRNEVSERGFAKGGSAEAYYERSERARSIGRTVGIIIVVVAVLMALIALGIFIDSMLANRNKLPKNINTVYGDVSVSVPRDELYDGSTLCIDIDLVAEMLGISKSRNGDSITYSTVKGDTLELTVGSNTVKVNGIACSMASKTRENGEGRIYIPAEAISSFVCDTTVTVSDGGATVTVVTLVTDTSEVCFTPKKSDGLGTIGRPSSLPKDTSYDPNGTTVPPVTSSPITTPLPETTPAVTEPPIDFDSIIGSYTFAADVSQYLPYLRPENEEEYLIAVNKKNPMANDAYPTDLVNITDSTRKLRPTAKMALEAMILEMKTLGVYDTYVCSGYRDYDTQNTLYNNYIKQERANHPEYTEEQIIAIASLYSAPPGASEHHTGLAVDFFDVELTFLDTKAYKFLAENAYKFGFILRYPEEDTNITGYQYEPWHWRFVGQEAAYVIYTNQITLEEYLGLEWDNPEGAENG